jgi:hypothetical protein
MFTPLSWRLDRPPLRPQLEHRLVRPSGYIGEIEDTCGISLAMPPVAMGRHDPQV